MGKMSNTRYATAREVILQFLNGVNSHSACQTEIYSSAVLHGFPNQNTLRGRLSELVTEGYVERRKGWGGKVWYSIPTARQ